MNRITNESEYLATAKQFKHTCALQYVSTPQCIRVSFIQPITPAGKKDILLAYQAENLLLVRLVAALHTGTAKDIKE